MLLRENLQKSLGEKLRRLNRERPLSPVVAQKLRERFEVEMTYNSNAIEGNTLTLKETYWVIQQGITVRGKPLKDHLEAKSHKEALDFLYDLIGHKRKFTVSEHLIKSLHSIILENIDREIAGTYRKTDVFISGADHKPPSPLEVPAMMNGLIRWSRKNHGKLDIVDFSALFHHKFVQIHPFQDGNGRTGRLLMNLFLMQAGFLMNEARRSSSSTWMSSVPLRSRLPAQPAPYFLTAAIARSLSVCSSPIACAHRAGTRTAMSGTRASFA